MLKHNSNLENQQVSASLAGKLNPCHAVDPKSCSTQHVYKIKTDNLFSSRSVRPKTRIEIIIEYLNEIMQKFEEYNNEEYVYKTQFVIKEVTSNKLFKYENQGDPIQNKLLSLYSPEFNDKEKIDDENSEDEKSEYEIVEDDNEDDFIIQVNNKEIDTFNDDVDKNDEEIALPKIRKVVIKHNSSINISKKDESSSNITNNLLKVKTISSNNVINKIIDNYDDDNNDKKKEEANYLKEKSQDILDENNKEIKNNSDNINKAQINTQSIDKDKSVKTEVIKRLSDRRQSTIKKLKRTSSILIGEKLIKPLDIKDFGVNFDVFSYAEEVGRIYLIKQVSIAAFNYREVYGLLKTSYFENYFEEIRKGYTQEEFAFYHNVRNYLSYFSS